MKHKNDDIVNIYNTHNNTENKLPYLITICKHQVKDYVTNDELREVKLALMKELESFQYYCIERHGKYKQLHAHGLMVLDRSIKYGLYTRYNGFRIHFKQITSFYNTIKYIFKHKNPYFDPMDIIHSNYYAYHYGF